MAANFLKQYIKFPTVKPAKIAKLGAQKITVPRIQLFCQKLNKLKRQKQQIQLISDYDHTLTKYKHQNKKCDSLFGMWVKNNKLPQKFREDLLNNYLLYGPYQTDGTIPFAERYELINQLYYVQTKLFQHHNITFQMGANVIDQSNIVFRAYTDRLLNILFQKQMPLYIISGGISDVIYTTIENLLGKVHSNISIHSNQMETYQQIQISNQLKFLKFKKSIIHSYNKYEIMSSHSNRRKHCILMGDLQSDIYMARRVKYQTIFSIFYAKEGQTDQRALAQQKFDIIVEGDGSHKILVELLKVIGGQKNINWHYLQSVHKNLSQLLI